MDLSVNGVAVGAVAVILLIVVVVVVSRELRRRALAAVAASAGFEFHSMVPLDEALEFAPQQVRRLNAAGNRLEGSVGSTRVTVLDILYARRTSSLNSKTIRTTVGAIPYSGPVFRLVAAAEDEAAVRAAVAEPLQRFCVDHPTLEVESTGSHLLLYRDGVRVPPDGYERFFADLKSLDDAVSPR